MTRFDKCLPHILLFEGGYVCHPADPGGATKCGITQRTLDEWCRKISMPPIDVKNLSESAISDIYRWQYWAPAECYELPPPVDLVVFDSAVNHGVRRAAKLLQEAVRVPVDGVIGQQTLNAVKNGDPETIALSIIGLRAVFYDEIVQGNPSQRAFAKGWANRINRLAEIVRQ